VLRKQLVIGTIMVVATVLFHVACLVTLIYSLRWVGSVLTLSNVLKTYVVLGVAVFGILAAHGLEAWIWAYVYRRLGQFEDMATALYFSVVTTTTLGYGDYTLSERWRVLASLQAIGGLILFGASTAFLLEIIRQFFTAV